LVVTILRARVRLEAHDEYVRMAARIGELARQTPGYRSHKIFVADDGERVMIVEFESEQAQRAWSERREHLGAKMKARAEIYAEYRIQVCSVQRESSYPSPIPLAALG
jgi:heme-degrading monooxygenase HmoA